MNITITLITLITTILVITLAIGVRYTIKLRMIVGDLRKERYDEAKKYQDLQREFNCSKALTSRLEREHNLAVRTLDSYYLASFHVNSVEVKSWTQGMYQDYAERVKCLHELTPNILKSEIE